MKVLCIDAKPITKSEPTGLVEGEVYTVIRIIPPLRVHEGYVLEEIKSSHPTGAYLSVRFVKVSDIDETELAKEREQLQTV